MINGNQAIPRLFHKLLNSFHWQKHLTTIQYQKSIFLIKICSLIVDGIYNNGVGCNGLGQIKTSFKSVNKKFFSPALPFAFFINSETT